jgi:SAM-dependent methyltransferase
MEDESLLSEQSAYYEARAPAYDEWWQRRGAYDLGPARAQAWDRQIREVEQALHAFGVHGAVLELAGGTGWWTQLLAQSAERLTVVDSSPAALELNRQRTARADIEYVVADVFTWVPPMTYDVVFFSFWLSHVPRHRFASFWSMVGSCLAPGGRAFVIDNHPDPFADSEFTDPHVLEYRRDLHVRDPGNGRTYQVVKVMYEPGELESQLRQLGWSAAFEATQWFLFGWARPGRSAAH